MRCTPHYLFRSEASKWCRIRVPNRIRNIDANCTYLCCRRCLPYVFWLQVGEEKGGGWGVRGSAGPRSCHGEPGQKFKSPTKNLKWQLPEIICLFIPSEIKCLFSRTGPEQHESPHLCEFSREKKTKLRKSRKSMSPRWFSEINKISHDSFCT